MTERPILFSAEMVRAILDGRKTQTRRKMKPAKAKRPKRWLIDDAAVNGLVCPYGAPGDLLWVREACWAESVGEGGDGVRYAADHAWRIIENTQEASEAWCKLVQYGGDYALDNQSNIGMRVPSIHMPRWASRITLRITDVRVERLQYISEEDAKAEGADFVDYKIKSCPGLGTYKEGFTRLWRDINGFASLIENPWVWVISFERVKP
jgi:hypothetical protein